MDNALFLHYPEVTVPNWQFRGINFEKGWRIVFVLSSTSPYLTLRLSSVHICGLAAHVRAPRNEMQCHGYPQMFSVVHIRKSSLSPDPCTLCHDPTHTRHQIPRKFIISLFPLADSWEMNQRGSRVSSDSLKGRTHIC